MKLFGKELKFNNNKVYHAGDKPTPSEIGAAAASHSHSYLPLSGGTLSGRLTANGKITATTTAGSWISGMTLTNATIGISTQQTTSSYHPILAVKTSGGHVANIGGLGDNFGFYGFKSGRTENATDWSFIINASTGAISATGKITASGGFSGSLSGNATTATTLQTARTINGTSFNGSANIVTSYWGTARTITIGNKGKSVNGSANVSWSLSEIGAAATNHNHEYLTGTNVQFGKGLYGTSDIGISGNHSSGSVSIGATNFWIKSNNYFENNVDKFMNSNSAAYQLYIQPGNNVNAPAVRWSTNSPTKDGEIVWSDTYELLSTHGYFTLQGDVILDTSKSEKGFKSTSGWGMYLNDAGMGWYDWQNGRGVMSYEVTNDVLVIQRRLVTAGGTTLSLNATSFSADVDQVNLNTKMAINNEKYNIDNYSIININDDNVFILDNNSAVTLNETEEKNIATTNLADFFATLVNEIKTLKSEVEELKASKN